MFQGWDVRQILDQRFKGQYLFFPLTPVNIEPSELGIKRLADRSFHPFGVLDPILWLLHMHGYCIF
jgi:hypothetical protein